MKMARTCALLSCTPSLSSQLQASLSKPKLAHVERPRVGVGTDSLAEVPDNTQRQTARHVSKDASSWPQPPTIGISSAFESSQLRPQTSGSRDKPPLLDPVSIPDAQSS